ncbi:MAG: hypothetical protein QXY40_07750 [Candidatus Methanomethylicia archaeon]
MSSLRGFRVLSDYRFSKMTVVRINTPRIGQIQIIRILEEL